MDSDSATPSSPSEPAFGSRDPFERPVPKPTPVMLDQRGRRRSPKDPGSKSAAALAWLIAIVVITIVAVLQRLPAPAAETDPAALAPPDPTLRLIGRVLVKVDHAVPPPSPDEALGPQFAPMLDDFVFTPEDRLRAAMLKGELVGAEAALQDIDNAVSMASEPFVTTYTISEYLAIESLESEDLESEDLPSDDPATKHPTSEDGALAGAMTLEAYEVLLNDAQSLVVLYNEGPEALPDATRARLLEHHPGFADIALVFGQDDTDPERAATLAGGSRILIAGFIAGVVFIGGGLIGVVLLILFIIGVGTGRIRSRLPKPAPGGSVYFEILPVFATLFLLLMLAMAALERSTSLDTLTLLKINLAAQWLILPAVFFWPVVRGVPMRKALDDMGWARGQGVIKETAAGVGGYLAGLPLLFAAAIFVQFLALLAGLLGVEEPPPGPNDLMDLFASGDAVLLLLLVSLTTLWAPIVEETVFRGGAFRHLAGRIHWFVAAAFIAIAFAVMHSYSLLLLPILLSLAMVFAVLRYWRGSLIAAVVAHFCQNALATMLMLLILPVT